jgi:2-polyprenyl-3-methyl-5-hydroxy-6-metoxy-1,4-benzoquinol methylase
MIVQIRRKLRKVHFLRSAYFLVYTWKQRAGWTRQSVAKDMLDLMREREDPWDYTTNPEEIDRFRSALEMLQMANAGRSFENAFEVGCSEGIFTVMLSPRCQSLLAVDISQAALDRAEQRCKGQNVRFEIWDLFNSPVPSNLDLTVVMDVLELYFSPSDVRYARDKLVTSLRPGGYLLLGNSRQNDIFETSWWGKWMVRGGKRIAEFFSEHPQLELVASETKGIYVNALFHVRPRDSRPLAP